MSCNCQLSCLYKPKPQPNQTKTNRLDGHFVACGSAEGTILCWEFGSGAVAALPPLEIGGAPVHCIDWSRSFHAAVACSLSPYAPLRVACFDPRLPPVAFSSCSAAASALIAAGNRRGAGGGRNAAAAAANAANAPGAAGQRRGAQRQQSRQFHRQQQHRRAALPDRLTPEHVRAMLWELRASAKRRGLYKNADDPDGQHLVVPADRAAEALDGSEAAAAAAGAGGGTGGACGRGGDGNGDRGERSGAAGGCKGRGGGATVKAPWEVEGKCADEAAHDLEAGGGAAAVVTLNRVLSGVA